MGGMSAQIPIKDDPKANEVAMEKVRADKYREVSYGHDGTWIAHPLINKIARKVFDDNMLGPNQVCKFYSRKRGRTNFVLQYHVRREDVKVAAGDLLNTVVPGKITDKGVRSNVSTCLGYCGAWIGGNGCIPLDFLMEDAATAEITRVQLWQWVKYNSRLDTGEPITAEYVDGLISELAPGVKKLVPGIKDEHLKIATEYLKAQIRKTWASDFLTSDLMPYLAIADGVGSKWVKAAL
jgi:malate synthase